MPQWELDKAPQFRITVCQKRHTASVIFGMSHILADGKGFLQYLYLLAALYNGKNPDVHNKREIASVLNGIHVGRQTMRIRYGKAPAVQPLRSQNQGEKFFCLCCFISENDFAAIRTKAKSSRATLNDVFMAAYARVIARRQSIEQVTISCPADLRRFHRMSDTLTVANMTGIYREVPVDVLPDDPFYRTLSQISIEMNLQKSRRRCFSGIPLLNWAYLKFPRWIVAQAIKKTYHIMPISYTNIGVIDHRKLSFNGCQMTNCFVTGTYRLPPDFQLWIGVIIVILSLILAVATGSYYCALLFCLGVLLAIVGSNLEDKVFFSIASSEMKVLRKKRRSLMDKQTKLQDQIKKVQKEIKPDKNLF